jgi:hypothetical protein
MSCTPIALNYPDICFAKGADTMSVKPDIVNKEELEKLIDCLDLDKEKRQNERIKARWLQYVILWDSRASDARRKYFALRSAVIIAGALIPALVGLRELSALGNQAWFFSVLSILASLVVAICAGIEGLFAYGEIWHAKRAATEFILIEGFRFFNLAGDYNRRDKTHKDLYPRFAHRVEDMIEREIKDCFVALKAIREEEQEKSTG